MSISRVTEHQFEPTTRDIERFWAKVDILGPDECWCWLASSASEGYGQIWIGPNEATRRRYRAHRLAFYLANGHWPLHHALHTCDNPRCCNPAHLYDGTDADNSHDAWKRNRAVAIPPQIGQDNPGARLTDQHIPVIRQLLARGISQSQVAAQFGVSQATISRIARGAAWSHVK